MWKILGIILGVVFAVAVSFLATAGIIAGICWAFSLTFSWKLAVGIYLILILVKEVMQINVSK